MGYFNETISQEVKFGAYKQMELFREVVEECELSDLGFKVSKYTWCNNKEGMEFTKDRLDSVLGNSDWHSLYDLVDIYILPIQSFDHYPLLISCHNQEKDFMHRRKFFRYEASWARREKCKDVIKKAWGCSLLFSSKVETTKRGLDRCGDKLMCWRKLIHDNQRKLIT